jgi:hypothetical protein
MFKPATKVNHFSYQLGEIHVFSVAQTLYKLSQRLQLPLTNKIENIFIKQA